MVSQLKVNEIIKQSGSSITIGEDGDTLSGPFTNTPAFGVYGNGTSVGANSYTKIEFQNEAYDTNSAFDTTNSRFTVPTGKAGYYWFTIVLAPDNGVTFTDWRAAFYKNGSTGAQSAGFFNFVSDTKDVSGDFPSITGSCTVNLAVGDYIEVYGFQNSGGSRTFNWPFFQGHRIAV